LVNSFSTLWTVLFVDRCLCMARLLAVLKSGHSLRINPAIPTYGERAGKRFATPGTNPFVHRKCCIG
jgi:hypothetical protein